VEGYNRVPPCGVAATGSTGTLACWSRVPVVLQGQRPGRALDYIISPEMNMTEELMAEVAKE
jgi:hypothetical protein